MDKKTPLKELTFQTGLNIKTVNKTIDLIRKKFKYLLFKKKGVEDNYVEIDETCISKRKYS